MASIVEIPTKKGMAFKAVVRRQGKTLTKRFQRKTDAKDWARKAESAIVSGEALPMRKRYTLTEAIDRYIIEVLRSKRPRTQVLQRAQLQILSSSFGETKLFELTPSRLTYIREELLAAKVQRGKSTIQRTPQTVNRYLQVLAHVLSTCVNTWEWLDRIPKMPKLDEPDGKTRFLRPVEAREVRRLLANEPQDVQVAVKIGMVYGSRLFETCALRWRDVDLEARTIAFLETKTGHPKTLPIPDDLFKALSDWKTVCPSTEYLFPTERRSKLPHVYDKVKRRFKALCERLELQGATFHTLRHTVGSWSTQDGTNRRIIGEVLGHRNLSTTDRYSHLHTDHLLPVISRIEERLISGDEKEACVQ